MVMRKKYRRRICLAAVILCFLVVTKCNVTHTVWYKSKMDILAKRNQYTPKISEEELNDFIKIWPEFKELNLMKTEDVSYNTVSQEDLLDWKAGIWFLYHHWDAERFFYVRQRVLSALQAIEVRNTAYSFITMLQNKKDGLSAKMIELQKQRIGADEFEDDEIGLIQKNEKILRSIFE
jgi:broad specificity phosphatase PhoE